MRILLSSIIFLLVGCGSYPKNQNFSIAPTDKIIYNPYFSDNSQDYIYRADIKVFKKAFSGIFIVKKLGAQQHRIVFTTEMGNKLFDFEILKQKFKINYILPEMNKKLLVNLLKGDFLTLIEQKPISKTSYIKSEEQIIEAVILKKEHFYFYQKKNLKKIVRTKNGKEKVIFLFSSIYNNIANDINIQHNNIDLNIHLKRL